MVDKIVLALLLFLGLSVQAAYSPLKTTNGGVSVTNTKVITFNGFTMSDQNNGFVLVEAPTGPASTTELPEGTNLYYTAGRVNGEIAEAIGVTVQAWDTHLDDIAGITPGAENRIITSDGLGGWTVSSFSSLDTNTNAATICSGSTTYLDGEGNCDDISSVYQTSNGKLTSFAGLALTEGYYLAVNGGVLNWQPIAAGSSDASTLDGLDSLQFLRSDTSDAFTSGTLTINSGTTFDVNSTNVSIADNNISFDSASGVTFTPTAGQDLSIALSGAGDLVVNTNDLFVDTSASRVGIGDSTPSATLDVAGDIQAQESIVFDAEVDDGNSGTADTINWGTGNHHKSTMTGNCTYTFTAPSGPTTLTLKLVQDGTGSRTATWPASTKWSGGTAPTLSTAASSVDFISCYYDGTNYYCQAGLDFQ